MFGGGGIYEEGETMITIILPVWLTWFLIFLSCLHITKECLSFYLGHLKNKLKGEGER